jgi:hypothetical protein
VSHALDGDRSPVPSPVAGLKLPVRLLVFCDGCRVLAGLSELAPQQRDEERCCEGHCYERESELFKHVHSPVWRGVSAFGAVRSVMPITGRAILVGGW